MRKLWQEFKEFAFRGNVIDMAVGVVIGGAFTGIVTALTGIITQVIGMLTSGMNFAEIGYPAENPVIMYGAFIQAVLNFLIIAVCLFAMIKVINRLQRKKEEPQPEEPAAPPAPTTEELLTEIRDLLKK